MFVHLHVHTEYSLLDGTARIKDLIEKASSLKMPAVAITDHGNMYGVIDFYKEAKNKGIKPIIGCEVYVTSGSRFNKEGGRDEVFYHLVLIAKNKTGYMNLTKLVSSAYIEGFYYKPRVDKELLRAHSEGLIALSACKGGEIAQLLLNEKEKEAEEVALWYQDTFTEGNFYLELQDHGIKDQKFINQKLLKISEKTGIPLVATNDVHYLEKEDAEAHDLLLCIQTGKNVDEPNRLKFEGSEFYFKNEEEMRETFEGFPPEVFDNTLKIADEVDVDIRFDQMLIPPYELPGGYSTPEEYLKDLCYDGLKNKYPKLTEEITERLEYELNVINQMGYASYFLIVWDFVRFARDKYIPVGPGRGSAAGSLVAYALSITNIDPLRYGLLFERFLNPERVNMPDIDIDFCYERRDEVIQYVVEKYGDDKVAQIITFGTMAARLAVRDVARALNLTYNEADRVAKMIPFEPGMTIEKAMESNQQLKELYHSEEKYTFLLDTSRKLEGLPRHSSTHAAGVVISSDPLVEHVPVQKAVDGSVVTQYPMNILEELGLLKMDFLGLRTLTIMGEALQQVNKRWGNTELITIESIPLDDANTFDLLSQGETAGVFQLESSGMRSVLRELKPTSFEDIIAVVALYRPGPMEQIPVFIDSKHGRAPIKYPHTDMEELLKETYGVMIYQEQIMEVASKMAGFSLGQADLLRRAIGKKKKEILDEQREIFIKGVENKGYDQELGEELYDLILKFASYGFNKSHAAAYALIAYQTAYLKANYPVEFMAALLTGIMSNTEKVALYIADSRRLGVEVLPPDVNESEINFTVVGENRIRFGVAAVKNVGRTAIEAIINTRKEQGKFSGLFDFCSKVDLRVCNRKVIESLIKCGAFDSLGGLRAQYLNILDKALAYGHQIQKDRLNGQISMFSYLGEGTEEQRIEDELPPLEEFSSKEKLAMEKEMVGLYISGHPLDQYRLILENLQGIVPAAELSEVEENRYISFVGIITSKRSIITKRGRPMAFLKMEDLTGEVEVIVFSDLYEKYQDYLVEDKALLIRGQADVKDEEEVKVHCKEITLLPSQPKQLFIKINDDKSIQDMIQLKDILSNYSGGIPVYLYFEQKGKLILTGQEFWVKEEKEAFSRIESLMGEGSLELQEVPGA